MPVPVLAARWDQMERDPRPNNLDWSGAGTIVHGGASRVMGMMSMGMLTGCRTELTRSFRFDEAGGWGFRPGQ